jgi:hypothetical protein
LWITLRLKSPLFVTPSANPFSHQGMEAEEALLVTAASTG